MRKRWLATPLLAALCTPLPLAGEGPGGRVFTGRVIEEEKSPVAGASLWAVAGPWNTHAPPPPSATSGADGSFAIPDPPAGPFVLYACGAGFLPWIEDFGSAGEPVEVALKPAAELRGRVLGAEGEPLAGVSVKLDRFSRSWEPPHPCSTKTETLTDGQGRFSLGPLEPDEHSLGVWIEGRWAGDLRNVEAPPGEIVEGLEIRVRPAGFLVRVVDLEGRPVSGAEVSVVGWDDPPEKNLWQARTASDGSARLLDLPVERTLWLHVEQEGLAPATREEELAFGERREVEVRLGPAAAASGRVVDEAGRPAAGVEVALWWKTLDRGPEYLPEFLEARVRRGTRTDARGRFSFHGLPEGEVELSLRHSGFVPIRMRKTAGSGDLGQIVIRRGATLTGTVADPEGRPLEGVRLTLGSASATTGTGGAFAMSHVETGRLQAEAEGYLWESRAVCRLDEPVHLTLWPRGSRQVPGPDGKPVTGTGLFVAGDPTCPSGISGRVLDPGGTPLVEALVTAYLDEGGVDSSMLEKDGSFRLSPEPPGPLLLTIGADGYESLRQRIEAPSGELRVVAVLTRENSKDCEPRPRIVPGGGGGGWEILQTASGQASAPAPDPFFLSTPVPARGRVTGPDGAPVAGALVGATRSEDTATSAADGSFEVRVPAHFLEEITASREGFAVGWIYVDPGGAPAEDLEIRLHKASTVTGRVLGLAAGEPDPEEEVTLRGKEGPIFSAPLQAGGAFRLEQIPPGTWELSTEVSGRKVVTSVTLQPGQEIQADLQLPAVHPVSGEVLDERGQPLAEARVVAWWEGHGAQITSTKTGADGRFELALPDGEYYLQIRSDGNREDGLRELRVQGAPVSGLVFRPKRATHLRGRLLGVAPGQKAGVEAKPVRGLPGHTSWGTRVDPDGYSIPDLHPGLWTIWAGTPDCTLERTIEIPPGTTEMELDLDLTNEVEP